MAANLKDDLHKWVKGFLLLFPIKDLQNHIDATASNTMLYKTLLKAKPKVRSSGKVDFVNSWQTKVFPSKEARGSSILTMCDYFEDDINFAWYAPGW